MTEATTALDEDAIRETVERAYTVESNGGGKDDARYPYPTLDRKAALIGLAGELVEVIEPHTEADPAALLIQFLTACGSAIGRSAHYEVEATRHYANVFSVAVGRTAAGRKGTALAHVLRAMAADGSWANCVKQGVSSGEGLIHAVRDPVTKHEPIRKHGMVTGYQTLEADPGVVDKRLTIVAAEFSQALKLAAREGNILSEVIRNAWDKGDLRIPNKNSPEQATDAHISIIGHISQIELLRLIAELDCANGFANRFLWYCARRSKELPDGGAVDAGDFNDFIGRLCAAVDSAKRLSRLHRSPEAREIWHAVYSSLSAPKPGLLGAIISRAEAQTLRLSVIYAAMRGSAEISAEDLTAALAVWDYCEQSARFIFGDRLGNPVADKILDALRSKEGMTRTDIAGLFSRNLSESTITEALDLLEQEGLAEMNQRPTAGRPAEVWRAVQPGSLGTKETKQG